MNIADQPQPIDQNQTTEDNSLGIQSGRDTIIHISKGVSVEQLPAVVEAICRGMITTHIQEAMTMVEHRLQEFAEKMTQQFSDSSKANISAFQDPDFIVSVRDAGKAYARSGDAETLTTLMNIVSLRSKTSNRSRLSLSLNDAINKVPYLTKNEIAELSLCFLLRYADALIASVAEFANVLSVYVMPLIPEISMELSSYQFLEAHGCAKIDIGQSTLDHIFRIKYAGLFSQGFDRDVFIKEMPNITPTQLDSLLIKCLNDTSKVQLKGLNKVQFQHLAQSLNIDQAQIDQAYQFFEGTLMQRGAMIQLLSSFLPSISKIFDCWDNSLLKRLQLTTTGITIGNANAQALGIQADLSIWIK